MSEIPQLELIRKTVIEGGVDVDRLGVVMVGPEQFYGEIMEMNPGHLVRMRNPKRLLRLQQVQPGNFRVDFLLIDLDLITFGEITLIPDGVYFLSEIDTDSQARMLALYAGYLETKRRASAAEAGIVFPDGRTGNVRPQR